MLRGVLGHYAAWTVMTLAHNSQGLLCCYRVSLFPVWPDTHTMYEQHARGAVNSVSDYIAKHNKCL